MRPCVARRSGKSMGGDMDIGIHAGSLKDAKHFLLYSTTISSTSVD